MTVIEEEPQNNYGYDSMQANFKRRKIFKNNTHVPHLTSATARNLLKHAVIVLASHIGYENASDVAINFLTDVADYFLKRITLLLKIDSEQINYGFPVSTLLNIWH